MSLSLPKVCLFIIVLIDGKIASMFNSRSLDIFLAMFASAAFSPINNLSSSKNSCALPLRALNPDAILSIHLSSLELATSNFLFLSVNFFITVPVPPIIPVNKAPSVPNLTLFNISVTALSSSLSIPVGPPNRSPKDPICSTSPTNTPSAAPPPKAPAINCLPLPLAVSSNASSVAFTNLGLFNFTYLPFLDAIIADLARLLAPLKAKPPGIPMLIRASVILPAAVASAFSSRVVRSSKNASTLAAFPLSTPRSKRLAPKEKKPLGIAIRPEPTPASIDSNTPTLLLLSA